MNKKIVNNSLFFLAAAMAVLLDQWTKYLAVVKLKGNPPYVIINQVFEFLYSENKGAAFGMMQGKQNFFFLVVLFVVVVISYALYRMPADKKYIPLQVCLFLIFSGAVGNMIDRVRYGYVVDFIYFKLIDFPIFNVADCYVTIATFMMMILFIFIYTDDDLKVFSLKKQVSDNL